MERPKGRFIFWKIEKNITRQSGSDALQRARFDRIITNWDSEMATERKKRKYRIWTKDQLKLLKQHSKDRTPIKKVARELKRSEATLRTKASVLGLGLGKREYRVA